MFVLGTILCLLPQARYTMSRYDTYRDNVPAVRCVSRYKHLKRILNSIKISKDVFQGICVQQ